MPRTPVVIAALLSATCAAASPAGTPPDCEPAATRQVVEAFLPADCMACWQAPAADEPSGPGTLRLDWIVPVEGTDDAPLAAAALSEAAARLGAASNTAVLRAQPVPPLPRGVRLEVDSGLAWNGYIGLSFALRRGSRQPFPPDAGGWLALVERIPAGEDGSPVARQLVRALVGPLPLRMAAGTRTLNHLRAVLLPSNSQADRLAAVGWVQGADGRLLAATQSRPGCKAR